MVAALLIIGAFLLLVGPVVKGQQQFSSFSSQGRVRSCAKCVFYDGTLPFNLQDQFKRLPNDPRCQQWVDNIPLNEYEDCGTPVDGESMACLYVNFTIIMENMVTSALAQAGQTVAAASNTASNIVNMASNPVGALANATGTSSILASSNILSSVLGGLLGTAGTGGSSSPLESLPGATTKNDNENNPSSVLASVIQVIPTGGRIINTKKGGQGAAARISRPKRQVMIGADNYPGVLSSNPSAGLAGLVLPAAMPGNTVLSQDQPVITQALSPVSGALGYGSSLGSSNGTAAVKVFYKGCVRLSLLETLAGTHCKLTPELADIRFFSQQALLQPLMDMINSLNQITGVTGTRTRVDGLCYFFNKEFAREIWNTFLRLSPVATNGLTGSGSSGTSSILSSVTGGILPSFGKK